MTRLMFVSLIVAIMGGSSQAAQTSMEKCPAPFPRLLGGKVFRQYPATKAIRDQFVRPRITRNDRGYRTAILNGAKIGPNFAGHYTIIEPGCGTATVCPAIVDVLTGKVLYPSDFHAATSLSDYRDTDPISINALNYKADSRLLIVAGELDDKPTRLGLSYYVWNSGRLRLLRFVPISALCHRR